MTLPYREKLIEVGLLFVAINAELACGAGRFAGKKILRKKIELIFLPPIFLP
jgi:hypothetical protein